MNNIRIGTEVDQSGLQSGLRGMRSQIDNTVKSLTAGMTPATAAFAAAGVAVTAFGAKLKLVIDAADRIDEMSQKLGVSATQFQKLEFMAGRAGVEVDFFKKTFAGISAEVAKGGEAFNNFGISTTNTNGQLKTNNELLEEAMIVIANITDPAERSAAAIELLGKKGMELAPVFNEGADSVRSYFKESEKAVTITAKQAAEAARVKDSVEDLTMSWNKIVTGAMAQFIPLAQSTIEAFDQMTPAIEKTVSIVADATNIFIKFVSIPAVQYIAGLTVAIVALPPVLALASGAIATLQANLMLLALNPVVATLTAITAALVVAGGAALIYSNNVDKAIEKQAEFMKSGSEGYSEVLNNLTRLNELQDKPTRTKEETAEMNNLKKEIKATTGYKVELNKATGEWVTKAGDAEMTMKNYATAVKAAGIQLEKLKVATDADFSEKINLEYETDELQRSLNDAKARHKKFNEDLKTEAAKTGADASKSIKLAEEKQAQEIATIKRKYRQEELDEQKADREKRLADELTAITYAEELRASVLESTYGKSQQKIIDDQIILINSKYDKELKRISDLEIADNKRNKEVFDDTQAIKDVETLRKEDIAKVSTPKTGIKSNPLWTILDDKSIDGITKGFLPTTFEGSVNSSLKNIAAIVGNTPLKKEMQDETVGNAKFWFNLEPILGNISEIKQSWENPMRTSFTTMAKEVKAKMDEFYPFYQEELKKLNDLSEEERSTKNAEGKTPIDEFNVLDARLVSMTELYKSYSSIAKDMVTTEKDILTQDAISKSTLISNMEKYVGVIMTTESKYNTGRLQYIRNYKDELESQAKEELEGRIELINKINELSIKANRDAGLLTPEREEAQRKIGEDQVANATAEYKRIVELIPQITADAKQKLKNESSLIELMFGKPDENQVAFATHLQQAAEMAQQVANSAFSVIDSVSEYKRLDRQKDIDNLKESHEKELESVSATGRKRKVIEKRQAEEMKALERENKKQSAKVKIAELVTSIPINAAMAFGQAMANFPMPAGPIIGGIAAAAVVANGVMGVVNARKEAENFAAGGIVAGNSFQGDRVPINVNSGEAVLTRGQQKVLMDMLNGKGSSTNNAQPISITIQGDLTSDKLSELEDMLYKLQSGGRINLFN